MRLLAERVLTEAPANNGANSADALNIGNFSSNFNTADSPNNLNLSDDLNANSVDNNIEVDDSFDDFNYESNFNSPSSSFGGGRNFGSNDGFGDNEPDMPNTKAMIQTITDYFPNEGTVELTDEEGVKTIKPLAQVQL